MLTLIMIEGKQDFFHFSWIIARVPLILAEQFAIYSNWFFLKPWEHSYNDQQWQKQQSMPKHF